MCVLAEETRVRRIFFHVSVSFLQVVVRGFHEMGSFDALGSAHPHFESARWSAPTFISFACPKETNQRKRHPTTCPSSAARGALRFSRFPARVNCLGPSLVLALRAPQAATIGLLPDLSLPPVGQTDTRLSPETAAMLGFVNGIGVEVAGHDVG